MTNTNRFSGALRLTALALALGAVSSVVLAQATRVPPSLAELNRMQVSGQNEIETKLTEERNLRSKAMREAALSYGARSGLLRRTFEIKETLKQDGPKLDAIYNFSALMLTDLQPGENAESRARFVVPPVITKMGRTFNQEDSYLIRQRDQVMRIETNARFAAVAPNWRAYLERDMGESVVALPHASLLPRTNEERVSWDKWVAEGFAAGLVQADSIFESDQARLVRDIEGMILYYELVDQKVVTLPFVATRNDGVTGDANQLNINDVTLKITVLPAFQSSSKAWVPTASKK